MTISTALSPRSIDKALPESSGHWSTHGLYPRCFATLTPVLYSVWGMIRPWYGGVVLGLALLGVACASIFVVIAEQDLRPEAIAFNRLLIAAIAFGGWQGLQCSLTQRSVDSPDAASPAPAPDTASKWRNLALFCIAGISFVVSVTCAAWSLTQTSVANSALLNNMMPIFTTLGAWWLLGKRFSARFVLGLGVAIVGIVAIGIQDLHLANSQLMGDAAALGAAICLAAALLSIEQLRNTFSTPVIMMTISFIGSLAIVPVVVLTGGSLFPSTWISGLAVVALALISQVIGHGLLTYSLKQFSSERVAVSMLTIPILSALLAMLLLAQPIDLINGCAFLIVLTGIYLAISATNQP